MSRDAWGRRWHAEQDAREGIIDDSGYENAPATRLVATKCVACGRPLVDAISVESGMGPDCREKYGHAGPEGATEEARSDVNKRVAQLARGVAPVVAVGHLLIIRGHGFTKLADRLEERLCTVDISATEHALAVVTPFKPAFTDDLKRSVQCKWDGKRWLVAADDISKRKLWAVVRRHFAGRIGRGRRGSSPSRRVDHGS